MEDNSNFHISYRTWKDGDANYDYNTIPAIIVGDVGRVHGAQINDQLDLSQLPLDQRILDLDGFVYKQACFALHDNPIIVAVGGRSWTVLSDSVLNWEPLNRFDVNGNRVDYDNYTEYSIPIDIDMQFMWDEEEDFPEWLQKREPDLTRDDDDLNIMLILLISGGLIAGYIAYLMFIKGR